VLGEDVRLDREKQRLVVGSSGRSYSIATRVLVEVVSADPARRRIALALANGGRSGRGSGYAEDIALRRGRSRAGRAQACASAASASARVTAWPPASRKEHESAVDEGPEVCGPPIRVSSSFTSSREASRICVTSAREHGRGAGAQRSG